MRRNDSNKNSHRPQRQANQQPQSHHRHDHGENIHQQQRQNYSPSGLPPPLPPGWVEATDPSTGKTYFANPQTQETQWDRPMMLPPPPPPPPPRNVKEQPSHHWNVQVRVPASAAQSYDGIHTNRATGRSTGEGNALYTAGGSATSNIAVSQPEKIVMVARTMLEKVQAFPDRTVASDLELHSLNPGQIADLCMLQQRVHHQMQHERQNEQRRRQQRLKEHANRHGSNESAYDNKRIDGGENEEIEYIPLPPYTPINPFTMPLSGGILLDRAEPGRLDVRMHTLREELKAFGYTTPGSKHS